MREASEQSKALDIKPKIPSLTGQIAARKPVPIAKSSPTSPFPQVSTSEDGVFKNYLERPLPAHPVH